MKITKILLAFIIISIGMAFGANLDLRVNEITGLVGYEVELAIVTENGFSNVAMMELELNYDDSKLTFTGSNSNVLSSSNINANNGNLKVVWIYSNNMMSLAAGDTLAKITFLVEPGANHTGDELPISFSDKCLVSDKNENLFNLSLIGGAVHVTENSILFSIPTVVKYSDNPVTVPVKVNYGFTDVAMVEMHIGFDASKLTYQGMESNYLTESNVNVSGDVLTILWIYDGNTINIPDNQALLDLKFNANMTEGSDEFAAIGFVGENNVSDADAYPFQIFLEDGGVVNFGGSSILLSIPSVTGYDGKPVSVPLVVNYAASNVGSIQLHVDFDNSNMTYQSLESNYLTDANISLVGNVFTIEYNASALNFVDSDTLLKFNFDVDLSSDVIEFIPVNFVGDNNVSDASSNPFVVYTENGGVNIEDKPNAIDNELSANRFELHQNYPNPFNPSTTINFNLKIAAEITIGIYSLDGKLIETLVDSRMENGLHKVTWNAENFSSGVYLYKLQTDQFQATRKCILMK